MIDSGARFHEHIGPERLSLSLDCCRARWGKPLQMTNSAAWGSVMYCIAFLLVGVAVGLGQDEPLVWTRCCC